MKKFITYLLMMMLSFTAISQEFSSTQRPFIQKNYIKNPAAEAGITGVKTYSDAAGVLPVDGTGGTPNVTATSSATTPLAGSRSFIFTKDAVNRQGQGWSIDFTIDDEDKGKVLQGAMSYKVNSGTYADDDVSMFIYDVTNARVIQPAPTLIKNSTITELFPFEFQSSIDSNSYRLILHIRSTSALAYSLKIDSLGLGRIAKLYGNPDTDYRLVTSGASINWSNATLTLYEKISGDTVAYKGTISMSGVPASGQLVVTIPRTIDTTINTVGSIVDPRAYMLDTGVLDYYGMIKVETSTTLGFRYTTSASNAGGVTPATPASWGSGDVFNFSTVPMKIVGLASSQVLSGDASTRVVAMTYTANSGSAGSPTIFPTKSFDTHNAYNTSTGLYTVPVSGVYRVSSMIRMTSNNGATCLYIYKNGANNIALHCYTTDLAAYQMASGSGLVEVKAGDTLGVAGLSTTMNLAFLSIERVSGPAQIAASEFISASYWLSANFASSTTIPINFDSKEFDSHNAVTTSPTAWKFTAPTSGTYHISNYTSTGNGVFIAVYKNGIIYKVITYAPTSSWGAGSTPIKLLAGEYIDLRATGSVTVNGGALSGTSTCNVSITRTGNY